MGGMGFRDFKVFNEVMFVKQFWRVYENLEFLVRRIWKVRYFFIIFIWDTKVGNDLSFLWRSVLGVCDLVERGWGWRVGNGKDIKI